MDAHAEKILEFVFQGAVAFAGLILVFLGLLLTSFDSYDSPTDKTVKKYRARAGFALSGFFAALFSAAASLAAYDFKSMALYYSSLVFLALSFGSVAVLAIRNLPAKA